MHYFNFALVLLSCLILNYEGVLANGKKHDKHGANHGHRFQNPLHRGISTFKDWLSMIFSPEFQNPDYVKSLNLPPSQIVAGLDTVRQTINNRCENKVLRLDKSLSSPAECSRTCQYGEKPKICYYHFVIEQYPVNGEACYYCTANNANRFCSSCQCVSGDGMERMALTVNRMIPGPAIEVCKGDTVVIDVENQAKGTGISIHWHGILQQGTQYFDGVPYLTQCPIGEGETFRYRWGANNPGTHFWHAHSGLQKMDGIFGSLIVRQPAVLDPHRFLYDFDLSEHVIIINDWMHEMATERFPGRNAQGIIAQFPASVLINGKGRFQNGPSGIPTNTPLEIIKVEPRRRYRIRLINAFCTICPGQITIQGHNLTVISTDGHPVKPVVVNSIISFAGERYDFILETDQYPGTYWIQVRAMGVCQMNDIQQVALLQYEGGQPVPFTPEPSYKLGLPAGVVLNPMDGVCNPPRKDAICISNLRSIAPIDPELLKPEADVKFFLPIRFREYESQEAFDPNRYNKFMVQRPNTTAIAFVDGISFEFPPSPPLSQASDLSRKQFCNSNNVPKDCKVNDCKCTHMLEVRHNQIVEIVLIDEYQAPQVLHPFHLHGHGFYVLNMGQPFNENVVNSNSTYDTSNPTSDYSVHKIRKINMKYAKELDRRNQIKRLFEAPPGKDTIPIPNNGFVVIRFRANNPGFWLFHCHFIYHQMVGMELIMRVGRQADLPPVPTNFPKCGNFKPKIHHERPVTSLYGYPFHQYS